MHLAKLQTPFLISEGGGALLLKILVYILSFPIIFNSKKLGGIRQNSFLYILIYSKMSVLNKYLPPPPPPLLRIRKYMFLVFRNIS